MNISTLGNHTYRLFWELPPGPDGKRRRETRTVHGTWQEAQAAWAKRQGEIDAGQATEPSRITLAELAERWLQDVAAIRVQASTMASYEPLLRRHVIPDLGPMKIGKVRSQDLQRYYGRLLKEGRADGKPGGLSPRSVRAIHGLLREIFGQAVRWGMLPVNPADFADPPEDTAGEMRFWTAEEAGRFLAAIDGHRLWALWLLAIVTGLRQGELLGLRWTDVDLETGALAVRQAMKRGKGEKYGPPKSKQSRRVISLAQDAVGALRAHAILQKRERLMAGPKWRDAGLVFTTQRGTALSPRNVLRSHVALCKKADVPAIRFHDLRHTHATILFGEGADAKTVQTRLGHHTASFTLQKYVHALRPKEEEAARRVEQAVMRRGRHNGTNADTKRP